MPDEKDAAKDAGQSGAAGVDVAAITKSVTEAVTKVVAEKYDKAIEDLNKNVGVLADTLKNAPPATGAGKTDADAEAPKTLSAEATAKLITDQVNAAFKTRDEAAGKSAERQAIVDKVVKEKLGGDGELAALLSGEDEAAIAASAEKLAAKLKTYKPDFGGAAKEGGTTPAGGAAKPAVGNLSPGTAKFAEGIKLPA